MRQGGGGWRSAVDTRPLPNREYQLTAVQLLLLLLLFVLLILQTLLPFVFYNTALYSTTKNSCDLWFAFLLHHLEIGCGVGSRHFSRSLVST